MNRLLALVFAFDPARRTVSGRVVLPNGRPAADAAVLVEGDVRGEPLRNASIDQRGKTFTPHVLVVTRGTTVDFPNNDTVLHNVFAQFEAKRFDLGLYPRGKTAHQTFDRAGIVAVRCNIHSRMSAYVVVTESPYHAVTNRDGTYRIEGVVPGNYRVRVWHESGATFERTLRVGERDERVDVALPRR